MKRPIALGALVGAVALVVVGGAALAAFPPTVTLSSPVDGQTWQTPGSSDLHVIGTVDTNDGEVVTKVVVTADSTDGGGKRYNATPPVVTFPGDKAHESFDVRIFPDHNGTYKITAVGYGRDCNIIGCGSEQAGPPTVRNVTVAWPPDTPGDVKSLQKDGVVTVEWASNNAEGDMLGYIVERAVGSGAFGCFKTVAVDSKDPETYTTTDDLTKEPDGTYKYRVKAVRKANSTTEMPTCAKPGGVVSPPSGPTSVTWDNPTPPPTTTTTRAGGGGGGGGGTTSTTRAGTSGGGTSGTTGTRPPSRPNLSALGSLSAPSNLARPPGFRENDPGFNELLPFGADGGEGPQEGGLALPQGAGDASSDEDGSTTTLLFVAAGLLATVLSAHVLWLKAQVDKMPLEALVPEDLPLGG